MSRFVLPTLLGTSLLVLAACSEPEASDPIIETDMQQDGAQTPEAQPEESTEPQWARASLDDVVAGEWRGDNAARDIYRHPVETLEFFELTGGETVIEIWPGGGWYSDILAPWIAENGGQYIAAHFAANPTTGAQSQSRIRFEDRMSDTALFGHVTTVDFSETSGDLVEPGTADVVLTFRNVHSFMGSGWPEKAFSDFYTALKPGGILGAVDHRLPSTREQDPRAASGYVQQSYVIALAEEAGFEFVGSSEVNANPEDTADHPFGVWTLPPVRRSANRGEDMAEDFDRDHFDAIGESDRMTLMFRKPAETETAQ